jgi:hypothetical protein
LTFWRENEILAFWRENEILAGKRNFGGKIWIGALLLEEGET